MSLRDWLFKRSEREKWAAKLPIVRPEFHVGLPALDADSARLYGYALPRITLMPRPMPDRPGVNHWMRASEALAHTYQPGQIILGKLAHTPLGHMDDRPMVT